MVHIYIYIETIQNVLKDPLYMPVILIGTVKIKESQSIVFTNDVGIYAATSSCLVFLAGHIPYDIVDILERALKLY